MTDFANPAPATLRHSFVILIQIATILSIVVLAERVAYQARQKVLDRRRRTKDTSPSVLHDSESR